MQTLLVRLRPFDPQRRLFLRRYAYRGIHFLAGGGWVRVPKAAGEYLRTVCQKECDPYSPPAFDVCTDAQAKALDARERQAAAHRPTSFGALRTTAPRDDENVVRSRDLPGGSPRRTRDEEAPAPSRQQSRRQVGRRSA